MSLDLGPDLSPTPEVQTAPNQSGSTLDLARSSASFRDGLPPDLPVAQNGVLLAAAALDQASRQGLGPEVASAYAAGVLAGRPGDAALLVEAARSYLDGGGTLPDSLRTGDVVLAQANTRAYTINGLSRIEAADMSLIPLQRQTDLVGKAWNEFVLPYAHNDVYYDVNWDGSVTTMPQIDFVDLKNIVTDLSARTDMTDIEKAFVWSAVVDWKGVGGTFEYTDDSLNIDNRGVRSELKDSHPGREWNTPSHTAVPFWDGVHGFGPLSNGAYIGYAYDSATRANERIRQAETHVGNVVDNPGDMRASMASTAAFHAWRDAPNGERFDAFATQWIRGVVDPAFR